MAAEGSLAARAEITGGRFQLASPRTALVLGVAAVLLVAAAVPLAIVRHGLSQGIIVIPFGVVGFVVARRQPPQSDRLDPARADARVPALGRRRELRGPLLPAGLPRAAARPGRRLSRGLVDLAAPPLAAADRALSRRAPVAALARGSSGCTSRSARSSWCGYTWQDATGIVARHIRVDSNGELVSADSGSGGSAVKRRDGRLLRRVLRGLCRPADSSATGARRASIASS